MLLGIVKIYENFITSLKLECHKNYMHMAHLAKQKQAKGLKIKTLSDGEKTFINMFTRDLFIILIV